MGAWACSSIESGFKVCVLGGRWVSVGYGNEGKMSVSAGECATQWGALEQDGGVKSQSTTIY